jgi:hypothetical protein
VIGGDGGDDGEMDRGERLMVSCCRLIKP